MELARKVGLSDPQISEIERGLKRINQDSIPIFCEILGCTPNDIFGYSDNNNDEIINPDLHQRLIDAIAVLSPDRQLEEIMKIEVSADIIKKNRK